MGQNNQRNPEGDLEMPELAFLYSECGCSDSCSEFNDTRCCTYCVHGSYCSWTMYCTEEKHEGCCSYCPGGKVDKDKSKGFKTFISSSGFTLILFFFLLQMKKSENNQFQSVNQKCSIALLILFGPKATCDRKYVQMKKTPQNFVMSD